MFGLGDAQQVQFVFLGQIRSIDLKPSCFEFVLDDGTGTMSGTWYEYDAQAVAERE